MDESPKARLKVLRDKLAAAVPRARVKVSTPPDFMRRLEAASAQVAKTYLLVVANKVAAETLDDLVDDTLVEGHLLLSEWERIAELSTPHRANLRPPATIDRRQFERHETSVTVKLLRHSVRSDRDVAVALETETLQRAARNVSHGGIFVAIERTELPQLEVGHVVHVQVGTHYGGAAFHARGIVMRREATGVGLSWVLDTERVRKDVATLLEAVRRAGKPAGFTR